MAESVRSINQHYWRDKSMSHLEIRTTHGSLQSYKAHSHSQLSVGVIESGKTRLSMKGREVLLQEGDIIIIEPGVVHSCNPVEGQPRSYHMLYIDANWCRKMFSALYTCQVEQLACDRNIISKQKLFKELSLFIKRLKDNGVSEHASRFDSLLFNMLSMYCSPYQSERQVHDLAYQTKRCLLGDLVTPPSLEELAQKFVCSKESIIRAFKRQYAITPKSFLNNSRLEKSKFLLKMGMKIVDVATEVGFFDQSQFHRAFVNYTASTPRQYQQAKSIFDNNR